MPQNVPEHERPRGAEVTGKEAELLAVSRPLAHAIVDGDADAIDRLLVDQCGIGERESFAQLTPAEH